jgi:hypothetical protein
MKRTLALVFLIAACGGAKKPADSPSDTDDTSSSASPSDSSAAPSDSSAPASSAAGDDSSSAPSSSASAAAAAPAPAPSPPAFGDSDCGKCVNTTCGKQLTACNNDTTCGAAISAVPACPSGAGVKDCVGGAAPKTGKPKKLFMGYDKCAAKAAVGKACKSACP